jgi:hypothetical protein
LPESCTEPSTFWNSPRTFVIMRWRTLKVALECEPSIAHVLVLLVAAVAPVVSMFVVIVGSLSCVSTDEKMPVGVASR